MPPTPLPIIDSHIHLFPASHLPTLTWYEPNGPLSSQHSITEYRHATSSSTPPYDSHDSSSAPHYLRGFIFLETDRISSINENEQQQGKGWSHALDEVSFLARIIAGTPVAGEGHEGKDRGLCLAFVPWAPVPGGPAVLERYMGLVKGRTQSQTQAGTENGNTGGNGDVDVWRRVRGVRYLVQDKPAGVMLDERFVEGVRWLGRKGLAFDLGVDARSGGLWQLREAGELMERVYEGVEEEEERVRVVINHMCKPNLRLPNDSPAAVTSHPEFTEWKALVKAMARWPTTYMKLSGGFSELPPLSATPEPDIPALVERLRPWTDVVFDAFGSERVMFGSDWPVCNVGGGGNSVAWRRWKSVVEEILERRGLSDEQKRDVWGGTAVRAYGVEV